MLAGIWQIAEYKGDKRTAFAILTEEPNELVAPYHDRMPLALADDRVPAWLDLANETPLGRQFAAGPESIHRASHGPRHEQCQAEESCCH
jgi:putative SOS response-associated peptidase YedK